MASRDLAAIDAALAWLRAVGPEVRVSARAPDRSPTPVPASLGLPADVIESTGAGVVGLVGIAPGDRAAVLRAYEHCRKTGVAAVACRLRNGDAVHLHFVDVCDTHGVVLVAVAADDGSLEPLLASAEEPAPKVTWARLGPDGNVIELDPASSAYFGWPTETLLDAGAMQVMHPDDQDRVVANWMDVLGAPGEKRRYRVRHLLGDGTYRWSEVTNLNRLEDPDHGDVLSEIVDISEEMRVHDELARREQLLRELTDALPVGVVQFDEDGDTVHENAQVMAIVGRPGLRGLLDQVIDDDRHALRRALAVNAGGRVPKPCEVHLAGDRVLRVTLRPLLDGGGVACIDDVTEAVGMRRELERRATFDDLTDCFTRRAILGALEQAANDGPGTGVVFVDLDRFKPVNDELGHAAGDELLAVIGARLRAAVRDVDLVGRLGGDEFLVVCPGLTTREAVDTVARRIADTLAEPVQLAETHLVRPRASIGTAWAPAGLDPDELVARADEAMFEAKRQSRAEPNTPTKDTISPG
jgi:diguanylate cyclase (GGDEF)-like protein/PAS domain S-box-containing protein